MDKRSKKRNKMEVILNLKEAITQAQIFDSERGATAHDIARRCGITPQYANKLLKELYDGGILAYRVVRTTRFTKRVWMFEKYARGKQYKIVVAGVEYFIHVKKNDWYQERLAWIEETEGM